MSHNETDNIDSSYEVQDSDDEYEYEYIDEYEYEYIDEDEEIGGVKKAEEIDYRLLVDDRKSFGSCSSAIEQFAIPSTSNLRRIHCQSRECCWSCGGEHHAPVSSCKLATAWIQGEVDMPFGTWPYEYILPAMRLRISEYAKKFGKSEEEYALFVQQQGWNRSEDMASLFELTKKQDPTTNDAFGIDSPLVLESRQVFLSTTAEANVKQNTEHHWPPIRIDAHQEFVELAIVKQIQCGICFDDFDIDKLHSLGCNHRFCPKCWRQYLSTMFEGNFCGMRALRVACPHPSCSELVCEQHIRKVAPDLIPRFEQHWLDSFVQANRSVMIWCPGPNCNRIAIKPRNDIFSPYTGNTAVCHGKDGCKKSFCFLCGEDPHDGLCQYLQDEPNATTNTDTSATRTMRVDIPLARPTLARPTLGNRRTNTLLAAARLDRADRLEAANRDVDTGKIQLCPTCKIPIEKNGGCNHMTCKCGTHFCWLCNADITEERYTHACGRYLRDEQETLQPQQQPIGSRQTDLDYIHDALEWKKAREDAENNDGRSCCNPVSRKCSEALATRKCRWEHNDDIDNDTIETVATSFMLESVIRKKEEIEQFAHFYKRYVAHHQGQHFAEGQCACVRNRMNDFTQISGMKSATDTDFFVEANQLLVASRRVLKNSYCYVYDMVKQTKMTEVRAAAAQKEPRDKNRKIRDCEDIENNNEADDLLQLELFQNHQEQLERFTEQLSEVTERTFDHVQRQRVLELMEIVSRLMEIIIGFDHEESRNAPIVK